MGFKSEIKQFCQTTTIKGLPRMIRAQGRYLRAMWAICVVFGSGVALYQLIYILSEYFKYETSTSTKELEQEDTIFPDVTICKTNPPPILSGDKDGNLTLDNYINQIANYMKDSTEEGKDILEELHSLDGYFQTVTDDHMEQFTGGHFLVECIYRYRNGEDFSCSNSDHSRSRFLTPSYPSCISFRPKIFAARNKISIMSAIFYLDDIGPYNVPNFGSDVNFPQTMGVELFIHPPNTFPNLRSGVVGSPGWETAIRVRDTRRQRAQEPYSNCRGAKYEELDELEDFSYTEDTCRYNCTQQRMLKKCNCLDHRVPSQPSQRKKHEFCGALRNRSTNSIYSKEELISRMRCLYNGTDERRDTCDQKCVENCLELAYEYQSTGGMWPHESRQFAFYQKYIENQGYPEVFDVYKDIQVLWQTDRRAAYAELQRETLIRRNFLKVEVYFDGRNVVMYKDTAIHTPSSVSGSLGGILNLWIGISFVTAMELVELIYTIFLTIFVKRKEVPDVESGTQNLQQTTAT